MDHAGELTLVLDPADSRTGVYWEGDLLDVLDVGAWDEDVEGDLRSGIADGAAAAGRTAAGDLLAAFLADPASGGSPAWLVRYRVRPDWAALLDTGDPDDEIFAMRFGSEWVEGLDSFVDLLEPVGAPAFLEE